MHDGGESPGTNPFATRWVRPGAIEFQFSADEKLTQVFDRLMANRGWGEIVGPHGSGKSCLLLTLAKEWEQRGRDVVMIELHDGQRRLPVPLGELACDGDTLVCIDGFEQLSWFQAWRLRRHVRKAGGGLLVTTHQSVGLPRIYETSSSVEMAQQLVESLTVEHRASIDPQQVANAYADAQGNLREMFFALYDIVEANRRASEPPRDESR